MESSASDNTIARDTDCLVVVPYSSENERRFKVTIGLHLIYIYICTTNSLSPSSAFANWVCKRFGQAFSSGNGSQERARVPLTLFTAAPSPCLSPSHTKDVI